MLANIYSENTQEIIDLAAYAESHAKIDPALYSKWDVKRGLRDQTGKGVLTGLTHISDVRANKIVDGVQVPIDGELFYRGYNIRDLVNGFSADNRFGYEEVTYLLLFDKLPNEEELTKFKNLLSFYRSLPTSFVRDIIMKAPSRDMMNTLARSVLTLYSYDEKDDDISIPNVLRQSLQLISLFPLLSVYGYQAYRHYHDNKSLYIHSPKENLSTAENILRILRPDKSYTPLEARILDVALVLHMEHGGGNNSTFTTHVVTSTHTDTYSAIAAALGSLKGPRHGGANLKVVDMIADMKKEIKDWKDEDEVSAYLRKLLRGEAFDHQGLIYGMGHAVYSTSDPRELIFKEYVEKLSKEKGLSEEFELYSLIEKLGPKIISQERHMFKGVCCNVDFYSGFVYEMLGIPKELFTPMFAVARIVGWSAHRIEELSNNGKIIRPAYKPVITDEQYVALSNR
ncbi:MAG: citrate/2-methylcitrate synthase [Lachnospiraceae bacterium]|nr:citrate/2-methylcitrate synthase [Lachnospiraceae bacterium]MCI6330570.1 citrate/2-methylcitrate synthase [Lachnospiraceae bacterium]MCI6409031.1 citrate/2-methylcitrate synthase [Lachnospiraceae bacterium]MCI6666190.1 citrate/2-methylcitrate synthase [Lachnospiraceae bacterium]MCI6977895.1 citrate/2-methylcitrate synthase [Lachnospiraceae bacterium]